MKKALITGITGQDGSYLAEFLIEKAMRYMVLPAARPFPTQQELTISLLKMPLSFMTVI